MQLLVSTITTVPPSSPLVMMISSLLDSYLTASLSRFGYGHLGLKVLVCSISFLQFQQKCQWCSTFVFISLNKLFFIVSIFINLLMESLERAFSFTSLTKLLKSLSSSFLLYTSSVGMKLKFFF